MHMDRPFDVNLFRTLEIWLDLVYNKGGDARAYIENKVYQLYSL